MDIRHMRQIMAIRDHGSFARAAQALRMSQPSLSATMSRLEDQLGVKLFHRAASGSELTSIGELIAERASYVLAETEAIIRDAELVASGEGGTLRLGIGTSLRPNFLPGFLRMLAMRRPELHVHVQVLDRDKLLPLLRARELDLIVCGLGPERDDESLVITPVMATKVVAVARPEHPLAEMGRAQIARFVEYPAGGSAVAGFTNAEIFSVCKDGEASHYVANDYDPLLSLALGGACTLIAPYFVVQPMLDSGRLAQINMDWGLSVVFAAITTRASNYSPMVRRAVEYAAELGKQIGRPADPPSW